MAKKPERSAARAILLNEFDEVLLLAGRDTTLANGETFWFTPGGGVECGESTHQALARELLEETGYEVKEVGMLVWHRLASFEFEGLSYRQRESYFIFRVAKFDVQPAGLTDLETRSILGSRWWPVNDLDSSPEIVYPIGLAGLIREWMASPVGDYPREID